MVAASVIWATWTRVEISWKLLGSWPGVYSTATEALACGGQEWASDSCPLTSVSLSMCMPTPTTNNFSKTYLVIFIQKYPSEWTVMEHSQMFCCFVTLLKAKYKTDTLPTAVYHLYSAQNIQSTSKYWSSSAVFSGIPLFEMFTHCVSTGQLDLLCIVSHPLLPPAQPVNTGHSFRVNAWSIQWAREGEQLLAKNLSRLHHLRLSVYLSLCLCASSKLFKLLCQ